RPCPARRRACRPSSRAGPGPPTDRAANAGPGRCAPRHSGTPRSAHRSRTPRRTRGAIAGETSAWPPGWRTPWAPWRSSGIHPHDVLDWGRDRLQLAGQVQQLAIHLDEARQGLLAEWLEGVEHRPEITLARGLGQVLSVSVQAAQTPALG